MIQCHNFSFVTYGLPHDNQPSANTLKRVQIYKSNQLSSWTKTHPSALLVDRCAEELAIVSQNTSTKPIKRVAASRNKKTAKSHLSIFFKKSGKTKYKSYLATQCIPLRCACFMETSGQTKDTWCRACHHEVQSDKIKYHVNGGIPSSRICHPSCAPSSN